MLDDGYLSKETSGLRPNKKARPEPRFSFEAWERRARRSGRGHAEVLVVLGDERFPLVGDLLQGVDRLDRAGVDAEAAVDALLGVDVEHLPVLVLAVDAVDRADVDAGGILHSDA